MHSVKALIWREISRGSIHRTTEHHCRTGAEPGLWPIGSAERGRTPQSRGSLHTPYFSISFTLCSRSFYLDRLRHNNELYETVCEATTGHHGMRLVSREQSKGIPRHSFLLVGKTKSKNNSVMANYHLAPIAQAKTKNVTINLMIRESEIITLALRSWRGHFETEIMPWW